MTRTRPSPQLRSLALAFSVALLVAAAAAPAADAAFPGKPGPIAYSLSFASAAEFGGGIFAHGPRSSEKARQLTTIHGDGSPSYSANGLSIVFSATGRDAAHPNASHLYAMAASGGEVRQLTSGDNYDSNPSFSPDGQRIVFDRMIGSSRTPHLFILNDRGEERQLTSGSKADYEPTFTPNGRRIVFVSNRISDKKKDRSAIYAMGPDGSNLRVLINTPRNEGEPDVSPNGKRILFMSSRDGGQTIYIATANGKHMRPLVKPPSTCIHRSCYSFPVWSPDEKHIAALYSGSYSSELVVLRADGKGYGKTFARSSTEEEGYGSSIGPPSWGPAPR